MDILFSGNLTRINKIIVELLDSQPTYELEICAPGELTNDPARYRQLDKDLLIADLPGYERKPADVITSLLAFEISRLLLVLHVYTSKRLIQPLLEAGADGYLSYNTTEEEVLSTVEELSGNL